jgi:hypothetical protein
VIKHTVKVPLSFGCVTQYNTRGHNRSKETIEVQVGMWIEIEVDEGGRKVVNGMIEPE